MSNATLTSLCTDAQAQVYNDAPYYFLGTLRLVFGAGSIAWKTSIVKSMLLDPCTRDSLRRQYSTRFNSSPAAKRETIPHGYWHERGMRVETVHHHFSLGRLQTPKQLAKVLAEIRQIGFEGVGLEYGILPQALKKKPTGSQRW